MFTLHKLPERLAYKHAWTLSDPEVLKRLDRANPRLDQPYIRKLQADPVYLSFSLSIKKLLSAVEAIRREEAGAATTRPVFSVLDIEELIDPIIFRPERNSGILSIYNYYDSDNVDKNLR